VTGDFFGKIKIYETQTFTLALEINSHARMVNSLDCDLKNLEVISGSEDTYLNYWMLSE